MKAYSKNVIKLQDRSYLVLFDPNKSFENQQIENDFQILRVSEEGSILESNEGLFYIHRLYVECLMSSLCYFSSCE